LQKELALKYKNFSVLGIDPGIATTGFAILEKKEEDIKLVEFGVIKTSKGAELGERLGILHKELDTIFSSHKIDFVAVEKIFFNSNLKTVMSVSEARGVVLLTSHMHKKRVYEYTPLEIKSAITGFGRATKSEIQHTLKAIFGLTDIPKPDDAADAIATALCHIYSYKYLIQVR